MVTPPWIDDEDVDYKECKEISDRIFKVLDTTRDEGQAVIVACMLVISKVLADAPKKHFPLALSCFVSSLEPMLNAVEKNRNATTH